MPNSSIDKQHHFRGTLQENNRLEFKLRFSQLDYYYLFLAVAAFLALGSSSDLPTPDAFRFGPQCFSGF
jgi:hypothetical protein